MAARSSRSSSASIPTRSKQAGKAGNDLRSRPNQGQSDRRKRPSRTLSLLIEHKPQTPRIPNAHITCIAFALPGQSRQIEPYGYVPRWAIATPVRPPLLASLVQSPACPSGRFNWARACSHPCLPLARFLASLVYARLLASAPGVCLPSGLIPPARPWLRGWPQAWFYADALKSRGFSQAPPFASLRARSPLAPPAHPGRAPAWRGARARCPVAARDGNPSGRAVSLPQRARITDASHCFRVPNQRGGTHLLRILNLTGVYIYARDKSRPRIPSFGSKPPKPAPHCRMRKMPIALPPVSNHPTSEKTQVAHPRGGKTVGGSPRTPRLVFGGSPQAPRQ